MAEVRDVVVRLALEQTKSKIEVDTSDATKGLEGVKKQFDDLRIKTEELNTRLEATFADAQQLAQGAGEGFRQAAEGMFTLVRGATLLGFSADSDLGKFLEKLAKIQGAFDVFRGSFDVFTGLKEGFGKLQAASTAAAASNRAFAATLQLIKVAAMPLFGAGALIAGAAAIYATYRVEIGKTNVDLKKQSILLEEIDKRTRSTINQYEALARALDPPKEALDELDEKQKKLNKDIAEFQRIIKDIEGREIPQIPGVTSPIGVSPGAPPPITLIDDEKALQKQREAQGRQLNNLKDAQDTLIATEKERVRQLDRLRAAQKEGLSDRGLQGDALDKATLKLEQEMQALIDASGERISSMARQLADTARDIGNIEKRAALSNPSP